MKAERELRTRRDFMRALLLAGAAAAVPRAVSGGWAAPAGGGAAVLSPDIDVYPRSAWAAFATCLTQVKRAGAFTRLTVHHEGNGVNLARSVDDVVLAMNGILEAHQNQGFGDIGYHFIVDRAGRVWEGRSLDCEGAHVSGMNAGNIGVMLLGNFDEQKPADDQVSALFLLVDALREKFDIEGDSIFGHRDLGQTACPGRQLYEPYIERLRRS